MTIDDVKKYFNTGYQLKQLTGMSHNSFSNWVKMGYVPIVSQMRIQARTDGALVASIEHDRGIK